jgi:hypothetical protein
LPEPLIKLHSCEKAEGFATVEVGKNLFTRLIVQLFGFPKAGQNIPVQVSFKKENNGEKWQRTFAGKPFSSFQSAGTGRSEQLLSEQFGVFNFGLALVVESGKLSFIVRRWSIFGISLPLALAPIRNSFEYVENERFCFNVEVKQPLLGLIFHYQGWLVPKE